jgi:hypothetical protein
LRVLGSSEDAYEVVGRGRKRVMRLNPQDAAAIGVAEDDMTELLASGGAPLRGWARLDARVARGSVALDARGLEVLRLAAGDTVLARPLRTPAPV